MVIFNVLRFPYTLDPKGNRPLGLVAYPSTDTQLLSEQMKFHYAWNCRHLVIALCFRTNIGHQKSAQLTRVSRIIMHILEINSIFRFLLSQGLISGSIAARSC